MAAGEDVEVAGFEFEDDGAGDAGFFAGCGPDLLGEAEDDGFGFGEWEVAREGVFGGDGFGGSVGNDGAVIDAAGELVETKAVTAEAASSVESSRARRSPTVWMSRSSRIFS